jgi:glycosyltransferase involved in cell wall biosynthesis
MPNASPGPEGHHFMRVLVVYADLWEQGGVPWETRRLMHALAERGHVLGAISRAGSTGVHSGVFVDFDRTEHAFEVARYDVTRWNRPRRSISHVVEDFRPDVALVIGLFSPLQAVWTQVLHTRGVPYALSPEGMHDPARLLSSWTPRRAPRLRRFAKRIYWRTVDRFLLRRAAATRVLSPYEAETIGAVGGGRPFVALEALDEKWRQPPSDGRRRLHAPVTFLYLGRLVVFQKGIDLMLAAWKIASERAADPSKMRLVLAGPMPEGDRETITDRLRAITTGNVVVPGVVTGERKQAIWDEADYFLHPSRYEGIAKAPREALGQGLPLIASRASNLGDHVVAHRCGFEAPLDVGDLADTFSSAVAVDATDYEQMSMRALSLAASLTWDRVATAVEDGLTALATDPTQ